MSQRLIRAGRMMRNTRKHIIPLSSLILLVLLPMEARAQFDLDSVVLKAIADLASAVPSFVDGETGLRKAINGVRPSKPVNFAQLAGQARKLADDFRTPPQAPWTGWDKFALSPSSLKNCALRSVVLTKMAENLDQFDRLIARGRQNISSLDGSIDQTNRTIRAAAFLKENMIRVIALPWFGSIFIGDILDLDKLQPALGELKYNLQVYRNAYKASLDEGVTRAGNYRYNRDHIDEIFAFCVARIELQPQRLDLVFGQSGQFNLIAVSGTGLRRFPQEIDLNAFSTSNTSVATVSPDGLVNAGVIEGTTTITAQTTIDDPDIAGNGTYTTTAVVTVRNPWPVGWYGWSNASPIDRESFLRSRVGNFNRFQSDAASFIGLCQQIRRRCTRVIDWEGASFGCNSGKDGTRLAHCD